MSHYDDELNMLRAQIDGYDALNEKVNALYRQRFDICERLRELERVKSDEQADVDRLKGRGIGTFIPRLTGKIYEMQDREQREAYRAQDAYDEVARELNLLDVELNRYKTELAAIKDARQRYRELLNAKAEDTKALGGAEAESIRKLDHDIESLREKREALRKSICSGNSAHSTTKQILDSLYEAKMCIERGDNYKRELISFFNPTTRYDHLENAQNGVETLRFYLKGFKSELADVTVQAEMDINIDNLLDFMDYFCSPNHAAHTLYNKILQTQAEVALARSQIKKALSRMEQMMTAIDEKILQLKKQREALLSVGSADDQ